MNNFAKFFSRKFLMLFMVFIAANVQIWAENISGWVWFSAMMVVGIGYPLFNVLEEKVKLTETSVDISATITNAIKEIKELLPIIKET